MSRCFVDGVVERKSEISNPKFERNHHCEILNRLLVMPGLRFENWNFFEITNL